MIDAEIYYVTSCMPIWKIAKLVERRYQVVRDFLFQKYPEIKEQRQHCCYARSKRGYKNHRYNMVPANFKGLCSDGRGYVTVIKPEWYTGRKKYQRVFYHHIIMCIELGWTEIPRGYCVHHIDGDKLNNDINNLALLTLGAHAKLHASIRKVQRLSERSRPKGRSAQHTGGIV